MPVVRIDATQIRDWDTFHDVFAKSFGFPDFYGRNMDAWIDCMSDIDAAEAGMTILSASPSDPVVLHLDKIDAMPVEIYQALVASAAFVNWRRIESGDAAILILAFYRSVAS